MTHIHLQLVADEKLQLHKQINEIHFEDPCMEDKHTDMMIRLVTR